MTNGDIEVNKILTKKISEITPNIVIVSEENAAHKNDKNLKNFWLIDPIDGTKDYISNRDEFTLNAALIIDNRPSIGILWKNSSSSVCHRMEKDKPSLSHSLNKITNHP